MAELEYSADLLSVDFPGVTHTHAPIAFSAVKAQPQYVGVNSTHTNPPYLATLGDCFIPQVIRGTIAWVWLD